MIRRRPHCAGKIIGQRLEMATFADIRFQQGQKSADCRVCMVRVGTGNDDLAIIAQVEGDFSADIDTQSLPDRLGQRQLAF
jgi:hypothetical protein